MENSISKKQLSISRGSFSFKDTVPSNKSHLVTSNVSNVSDTTHSQYKVSFEDFDPISKFLFLIYFELRPILFGTNEPHNSNNNSNNFNSNINRSTNKNGRIGIGIGQVAVAVTVHKPILECIISITMLLDRFPYSISMFILQLLIDACLMVKKGHNTSNNINTNTNVPSNTGAGGASGQEMRSVLHNINKLHSTVLVVLSDICYKSSIASRIFCIDTSPGFPLINSHTSTSN